MEATKPDPELARQMLIDAGCDPSGIRVEGSDAHWLVAVKGHGAGATDATSETMDTPQEVAAALIRALPVAKPSEAADDLPIAENTADGGDHVADQSASADHDPEAVSESVDALASSDVVEQQTFEPQETLDASEPREPEASFIQNAEAEDAGYEAHEETGAGDDDAASDESAGDGLRPTEDANAANDFGLDYAGVRNDAGESGSAFEDADFTETDDLAILETDLPEPDLGAELLLDDYGDGADPLLTYTEAEGEEAIAEPEHAAGAFIFGDNLHQMRTAAIGLVVQAALERMPDSIDYARMSELRNFTMGVSEGRWPDDPAQREELDTLEARERLRRAIEACRDAKVAALLSATREEIEAFDVESDWP